MPSRTQGEKAIAKMTSCLRDQWVCDQHRQKQSSTFSEDSTFSLYISTQDRTEAVVTTTHSDGKSCSETDGVGETIRNDGILSGCTDLVQI